MNTLAAGEEQQVPSATQSMSKTVRPPASGWIRHTDLARASGAGLLSTPDRHNVLHELSQVRVLLVWLRSNAFWLGSSTLLLHDRWQSQIHVRSTSRL